MNIAKEYLVKLTKYFSLFIFLISYESNASFLIEPHLNSTSGSFEVSERKGKFTGEMAGLRLAYTNRFFMMGLNLEKGNYKYDSELSSSGITKFNGGGVGTFLGFHFFEKLRIWTGYLNSTHESKDNDSQRFFGQQVEFGIGYRVFKNIFINYSYFNNTFTQEENDIDGTTGSIDEIIKIKANSISLSSMFIF